MVRLQGIEKFFFSNGVKALSNVDFDLKEGEIHALLGENGAGKSTLMHVMAGYTKPGKGHIYIHDKEFRFPSPAHALAAGIGMVRQNPHMVPGFTVWENCVLGSTPFRHSWINRGALRKRAAELNERWGFDLSMDSFSESLSSGQNQKAAILGLLLRDVRFLVFDEPAAVLAPDETEKLFAVFNKLKGEGKGIVLISHKLEETLKLADRVTILRHGKTQAVLKAEELSGGEPRSTSSAEGSGDGKKLRDLIFGEEEDSGKILDKPPLLPPKPNVPPALELDDFSVCVPGHPIIRGISFRLEQGRILGIAGVRDSGLETLELAIAGYLPSSGTLRINGTEPAVRNTRAFRNAGGAYLGAGTENAARSRLPVWDILSIHSHRRLQKRGFLKHRELENWAREIMKRSKVPHLTNSTIMSLSGGQLQRILLMREYAEKTPLLVLAEPGKGLDARYWRLLNLMLKKRSRAGTGILIFSTDTEALLAVSDEVMVLRNGLFTDRIPPDSGDSRERLRKAMVGET
jgi:simple sugar transport system ATP-binding protein